jgi:hypothetical protein
MSSPQVVLHRAKAPSVFAQFRWLKSIRVPPSVSLERRTSIFVPTHSAGIFLPETPVQSTRSPGLRCPPRAQAFTGGPSVIDLSRIGLDRDLMHAVSHRVSNRFATSLFFSWLCLLIRFPVRSLVSVHDHVL